MLPAIALRCHGGLPPKECVRQAVAAERAGFSTVWFAENPFSRGAYSYCPVGTKDVPEILGQSVQETLFFAVEATTLDGQLGTAGDLDVAN